MSEKRDSDRLVLKKEYDESRCRWDYSSALENDVYYSTIASALK
jgi:hypothetical protein